MTENKYEYEQLSTKEGFNRSLSHFRTVSSILGEFTGNANIADLLNEKLNSKAIEQKQVNPVIKALLIDKFAYYAKSYNMENTISDFSFSDEIRKWDGIDIIISYFHPELGISLINPKRKGDWEAVQTIKRNELVTIYTGGSAGAVDQKQCKSAADAIMKYLTGKKAKVLPSLLKGQYKTFDPKPQTVLGKVKKGKKTVVRTKGGKSEKKSVTTEPEEQKTVQKKETVHKRMTPMYSVPVTNELFHNGNVEAWKKIIQSYNVKHPNLEVFIFYEGERIHDIHALFKWGKVKHGSTIVFAVGGEEIKDVAKLQRYFKQGASQRFEDFLRFPVDKILNLF